MGLIQIQADDRKIFEAAFYTTVNINAMEKLDLKKAFHDLSMAELNNLKEYLQHDKHKAINASEVVERLPAFSPLSSAQKVSSAMEELREMLTSIDTDYTKDGGDYESTSCLLKTEASRNNPTAHWECCQKRAPFAGHDLCGASL